MSDSDNRPHDGDAPCTESKLLALHTANVCLVRTLALSGVLDRDLYRQQLGQARQWLAHFDHCGHNVAAFDALLEMLKDL